MKTILKTLLIVLASTALCTGCNDNGNVDIIVTYPVDVDVSDYSLTETPCSWNRQTIKRDTLYIINSTEELLTYISCQKALVPPIDFEKHSLLLARGGTPSWILSVSRHLQQTSINEYKLLIDIKKDYTTLPGSWLMAILTPKLSSSVTIDLEIKQHY